MRWPIFGIELIPALKSNSCDVTRVYYYFSLYSPMVTAFKCQLHRYMRYDTPPTKRRQTLSGLPFISRNKHHRHMKRGRHLPTRRSRFKPKSDYVWLVVDKVTLQILIPSSCSYPLQTSYHRKLKKNSIVWVRERPQLFGEVIANFLRIEGATWSAWRIPTAVFSVF
jgi:hypothetical protein